jgi:hypothetical protein
MARPHPPPYSPQSHRLKMRPICAALARFCWPTGTTARLRSVGTLASRRRRSRLPYRRRHRRHPCHRLLPPRPTPSRAASAHRCHASPRFAGPSTCTATTRPPQPLVMRFRQAPAAPPPQHPGRVSAIMHVPWAERAEHQRPVDARQTQLHRLPSNWLKCTGRPGDQGAGGSLEEQTLARPR